jgi:cystinosin
MAASATLSEVLGWSYFLCWSFSFYPQFLLNCTRKNTEGLSIDFQWLNLLGFACYAFFNCMMYWNDRVKADDAARNGGESPDLVKVNDVFFALHAFALTLATLLQIYIFGPIPTLSPLVRAALSLVFLMLNLVGLEVLARDVTWDPYKDFWSHNMWSWLGFCLLTSFVKLGVTLVKYLPQAYLNYKRKSTEGWAITNILLDFSGGALSFAQLLVDAKNQGDWSLIADNPVKLMLSFISIAFDILFMVQHFYLYPAPPKGLGSYTRVQDQALIAGDQEGEIDAERRS